MKKNKIVIIISFLILLITFNTECYADANDWVTIGNDIEKFQEMSLYEKQNQLVETAERVAVIGSRMSPFSISYVYYIASYGAISLPVRNTLSYYSMRRWLVPGALPKTEDANVLYVYNNATTYKEQKEKGLIDINLLLSALKKGDILVFDSKTREADKYEECMIYLGEYNVMYYTNGSDNKEKLNLGYYLGLLDGGGGRVRQDDEMPLVAIARPLSYGGYVVPYVAEEKIQSKLFYRTYRYSLHKSSSSYFNQIFNPNIGYVNSILYNSYKTTYDVKYSETEQKYRIELQNPSSLYFESISDQDVNYNDNSDNFIDNNKLSNRFYTLLNSKDSIFYKIFRILKNIASMILLVVTIIIGIRYMIEVSPERKSKMKKGLVSFLIGAIAIFASDKIGLIIVRIFIK